MPPRPEGTDGSDHRFREVVENRYKRIATLSRFCGKTVHAQLAAILLKSLLQGVAVLEMGYPQYSLVVLGVDLCAFACWHFAHVGTSRESLRLLKTYNVLLAVVVALHVLMCYQYHNMWEEETRHPAVLRRYLVSTGYDVVEAETWARRFHDVEYVYDVLSIVVLVATTWVNHLMILEKMDAKKAAAPSSFVAIEDKKREGSKSQTDKEPKKKESKKAR